MRPSAWPVASTIVRRLPLGISHGGRPHVAQREAFELYTACLRLLLAITHQPRPIRVPPADTLVGVFDLARELLADDGTLWLNMGDSYGGSRRAPRGPWSAATEARAMTASRRRDDAPRSFGFSPSTRTCSVAISGCG